LLIIARINLTKIDALGIKMEFERGLKKWKVWLRPRMRKSKPKIAMDKKFPVSELKLTYWHETGLAAPPPEELVLDAWSFLEAEMRAMIDAIYPTPGLWTPPLRIPEAARELGLTEQEIQSLVVLRDLPNKIAHSAQASITWDDAMRFMGATERLLAAMKKHWKERRKPRSEEK
jgi:hypothetical protein